MKELITSMFYWKMATFRCLVYMFVIGGNSFMALTEMYDGAAWNDLSRFEQIRIYIHCGIDMLTIIVAFLDQTMSRMNGGTLPPLAVPQMQQTVVAIPATTEKPPIQEPPVKSEPIKTP